MISVNFVIAFLFKNVSGYIGSVLVD